MTITLGSDNEINDVQFSDPIVLWLTSSKGVVVSLIDLGSSNEAVNVWELDRSGDTITIGSPVQCDSFTDTSTLFDAAVVDETRVIVIYRETSGTTDTPIYGRIYDTSTSSFGSRTELLATGVVDFLSQQIRVGILNDGGKGVLIYRDQSTTNGHAVAFTISGTTIGSPGSAHEWRNTATSISRNICKQGETDAIPIIYTVSGTGLVCKVLSLSGTAISSGSELTVSSQTTTDQTIIPLDLANSRYVVIYRNTQFTNFLARVQTVVRSSTTMSNENSTGALHASSTNTTPFVNGGFVLNGEVLIWAGSDSIGGENFIGEVSYDSGSGWTTESNYSLAGLDGIGPLSWTAIDTNVGSFNYFNDPDIVIVTLTSSVAPAPITENSFRFMGFTAGATSLYVTGLKDNSTLTMYRFNLATLAENGTATFGSATNTEVDAGERLIKPVWNYLDDGKILIYGRDGNNVQAQVTDTGTGPWANLGPGTPTWASSKVAVALMPWVLKPTDFVIVFSDDDVFRSIDDGITWIKQGDAGAGIAFAKRHAIFGNRILLGGTAAGTFLFSNNFGQTFVDRSGTILDGVVQGIAISYDL